MQRWISRLTLVFAVIAAGALATTASAQVTTGSVRGIVSDSAGRPLEGSRIIAIHLPSGTQYVGATRADGRFNIPGMRVGGPYQVSATMIGYARQSRDDIVVSLGSAADLVFVMNAVATQLSAVTVTSEGGELSSTRTGAATSIRRDQLEQLPTISRRLQDFTRLTPQSSGTSFAGADGRLNNITVDGAYFNNSFGLGDGQTGGRTGVAPISLDAIEAVQVNVAPYDVRQGSFVGAAVNTVTRSGTNEWNGSVYGFTRNESLVGRNAGGGRFNPGSFTYDQFGFRVGGPILKNKLFFFVSYEQDERSSPLSTFRANLGGEAPTGNVTRVPATTMDALSSYLQTNFNYATGGYENIPALTPSTRLTARLDYALSDRNKFTVRLTQLDSENDTQLSTSSSLGAGRARNNNFLNFAASNYSQLEIINSVVAEWNSLLTDRMSNQMIIGLTKHDESRGAISNLFPFVDIREGGQPFTAFGAEPFTPNNELRYESFQFQNNFTIYGNRHDLTFGVAVEAYKSDNVFFPGRQSAYVYNSLQDFYDDADDFIAQCGSNPAGWDSCSRTTSPVNLNRFQVRYSNILGQDKPLQPLEVLFSSAFVQDEWRVRNNLTVTAGLRMDVTSFGNTGFENAAVNSMNFRDENGNNNVRYNTGALPKATPLFSPRLGFNYDLYGNGNTVVRGGTGLFTGRPLYVWISNQIGNNGILTGFIQDDDDPSGQRLNFRPFHPNPDHYKPDESTLQNPPVPAATYELALTDNNFKFPQIWRSNVALDHRFSSGWRSTLEFIWGQDVNGIYYINANLPQADAAFTGPDDRPRWASDKCPALDGNQLNRINCTVTNAIVLKNQNVGRTYNASISIERAFDNGFYTRAVTAFGRATNTVDPGSIAGGSFNNNPHSGDPNNPGAANANSYQGRRSFLVASYTKDFFGWGNTALSAFIENFTLGTSSYTFSNDMNGDGGFTNDLIYVPRDMSEMNFAPITSGAGSPFTAQQQMEAFEAYINQDPYLRTRRGQYAERNGLVLPTVTRMDVSVSQDISRLISGTRNALQIRLDILNFTNMLNSDWGLATVPVNTRILTAVAPLTTGPTAGHARYQFARDGAQLLNRTYRRTAFENDVWRMQLGLRYTFN